MRLKHPNGQTVYLSYVTSAHPAPTVAGICAGLEAVAAKVRRKLDTPRLGLTLVIPSTAALELETDPAAMPMLKDTLARHQLDVTSLHGVPVRMYDPKKRYGVFRPDWAEQERFDHTLRLMRILNALLPDDVPEGIVSTIPFYWRTRHDSQTNVTARNALSSMADALADSAHKTGRTIRMAMEPEPGCAIETVDRAIGWLDSHICNGSGRTGDGGDNPWIGLCCDACHMAVQFENADDVLARARTATAKPLKLQMATGLRIEDPVASADWLERFVDPGRLHQTRERRPDGRVYGVDDLSAALPGGLPGDSEWRIHYHLPVYLTDNSTQDYLGDVIRNMMQGPDPVTHVETETYTWPMLPEFLRPPGEDWIAEGLAREVAWARDQLQSLGLTVL